MLTPETLSKLVEPKPGHITSRLPTLFARKNAALIAGLKATPKKETQNAGR